MIKYRRHIVISICVYSLLLLLAISCRRNAESKMDNANYIQDKEFAQLKKEFEEWFLRREDYPVFLNSPYYFNTIYFDKVVQDSLDDFRASE